MARQLENWLTNFLEWTEPRSEAPKSFLTITGLFTLAVAVRKHVKVPKKYLGGWECYPNIYVVIVGEPGIARKTTTMDFGDQLLLRLPNTPAAPTVVSQAALLSAIVESPDGSIYITASELASLVQKSKIEMFEFLNDGYDTRKAFRGRTISRGNEVVENPCINMFACTQPVWMKENMPASVITGGFASRTLFIYEEEPGNVNMYYTHVDIPRLETLTPKLINDLEHISNIKGEFELTKEAYEFMQDWYKTENRRELTQCSPKLRGYYARKPAHAHKLAMLFHLSYSDDLVLQLDDFRRALEYLESIEKNMIKIFGGIGKNIYTSDIDALREYFRTKQRVPRSEVYVAFQSSAEPTKLQGLIDFLVITKELDVSVDKGEFFYTALKR